MTALAEDPTAAAVLAEAPCYPVPPDGRSPAIEAVREARAGSCLAIGRDGVCLILRRAWLALDLPVTPPIPAYLPYGSIGVRRADLRCGLIPAELLRQVLEHFRAALPNEAAAFILWDEANRRFWVDFPQIDRATPSHLTYRPPALPPHHHLICDIHSHGHGAAFFSATDDADDAHATKIALVVGRLGHTDGPAFASRLCAGGMFLPLPRSPFFSLHSPSGVAFEVKIACIRALDKDFLPQAAPAVAQTAGSGRIRPRSRCFLAQGRRFSAQRTDLSSRFRSV